MLGWRRFKVNCVSSSGVSDYIAELYIPLDSKLRKYVMRNDRDEIVVGLTGGKNHGYPEVRFVFFQHADDTLVDLYPNGDSFRVRPPEGREIWAYELLEAV